MLVRAPASSANLGPGFDCLGLALELPFWLAVGDDPPSLPTQDDGRDLLRAEPTHPAAVAFVRAGGPTAAALWWRSPIPPGRGLGFSGAARVAGAWAALRLGGAREDEARHGAAEVAAVLEGHPDNAAASAHGGLTVTAGGLTVGVAVPTTLAVGLWWPDDTTSTDSSRASLPAHVPLGDAVFSASRCALWVAALASGDLAALRVATEDRLHQPTRLAGQPASARAVEAMAADPGCLGAWLSGSGPAVACLLAADPRGRGTAAHAARTGHPASVEMPAGLPPGHTAVVGVDRAGVREQPVHQH